MTQKPGTTFKKASLDDAANLYAWRQVPHVARQMATSFDTSFPEHCRWLRARIEDPAYGLWIIMIAGHDVGSINVSSLKAEGAATWGFYIADEAYLGLGAMVPAYFYNRLFARTAITLLRAEVLEGNEAVHRLHMQHGYVRVRERDRTLLHGQKLLSYSLSADDWANKTRYHRFVADFEGMEGLQL